MFGILRRAKSTKAIDPYTRFCLVVFHKHNHRTYYGIGGVTENTTYEKRLASGNYIDTEKQGRIYEITDLSKVTWVPESELQWPKLDTARLKGSSEE